MTNKERDKLIKECKYKLYLIKREMIILKKESKILRRTLNSLENNTTCKKYKDNL